VPKDVPPFALLDVQGRIAGLNRVGMRRAALSRDDLADVREAYRVLFNRTGSWSDALASLERSVRTDAGRRILAFVRAAGKRGVSGRARRSGPRGEAADSVDE